MINWWTDIVHPVLIMKYMKNIAVAKQNVSRV